ncbi:MAG TPA: hypothetical protein VFQ85_09540 [Mycobacteriales bacterium]|jgi:hypothetical protein|nr:hypothetical protein [Mycobacteriales bacterium]
MTEPVLTRDGTTPLYWAGPAPTAGFVATADLGGTATLTATWADGGGTYVFLGTPAPAGFAAAVLDWLTTYRPRAWPRFLWVLDPAQPTTTWTVLEATVRPRDGGGWTFGGGGYAFSDYLLTARGDVAVAPGELAGAGWGFVLGDTADAPALTFYSPTDAFAARAGTSLLSLDAAGGGAWHFVVDSPPGGDVFARLGAGMRYFTAGEGGYADTVRFTVLDQGAAQATLYARLDPLRPLDPERTAFGFFPPSRTAPEPPAYDSGYATAYGHDVGLRPLAAGATTTTPARLVFGVAPYFVSEEGVNTGYHLVPDGPFALDPPARAAASDDGLDRVVCGMSGMEYLGLPAATGCALRFVPGQPAYAPLGDSTTGAESLVGIGTTSWVYVESPREPQARYYSQAEDAPLYTAGSSVAELTDGTIGLLGFCELVATDLPAAKPDEVPPCFPMAPFRRLAPADVQRARAVEQLAIAPRRRSVLLPDSATPSNDPLPTSRVAVTPQGLGVGIAPDDRTWTWLGIGHTGDPAPVPSLRFTRVDGAFANAMRTNNLFMVVGDQETFTASGSSVAYELTGLDLAVIATLPSGNGVRPAVLDAVRPLADVPYDTRQPFVDAVCGKAPDITAAELAVLLDYAGRLTPAVGGWPFRLSPDSWGPGTFLVFKFVLGRSLATLVEDVSTWAWPEAASAKGPDEARRAIAATIAAARQAPASSPYAAFVTLVDDPHWTGILALNVEVPLAQLPAELQVLAAGIDPAEFRAHHFAMSVTPVGLTGGAVSFLPSSTFGLIDYENPEDQYFTEEVAFAFRVLQLTVGISNSVVTTFNSRAELLVNRLFGAPTRLFPTTHGNNVILDGAHQRQRLPDNTVHDTYVFSMATENLFQLNGLVLQSVELLSTQLVTAKASDAGSARVDAMFQLGGNLRFFEPEGFDPFCWGPVEGGADGYVRFGNLGIAMSFDLGDPAGTTTFALREGTLSFDLANSVAREHSLVTGFPLRLSGLVSTADPALTPDAAPQTPEDLGYVSVTAPIQQSRLDQPWYGLDYVIDLGTLGAMAGNAAIALHLLVGWSPGASGTDPAVYVGVRLPGAKDALGVSLPLQGVVKLGFKSIELQMTEPAGGTQPAGGTAPSYTLRMRNFALRLLGLSFPPGYNDVILFGDPNRSGSSKVGWYLAYASDVDPARPPAPPSFAETRRLRAVTRGTGT